MLTVKIRESGRGHARQLSLQLPLIIYEELITMRELRDERPAWGSGTTAESTADAIIEVGELPANSPVTKWAGLH
jgi:hypothetical protein